MPTACTEASIQRQCDDFFTPLRSDEFLFIFAAKIFNKRFPISIKGAPVSLAGNLAAVDAE